jgi:predicted RNase H-related nuclease YkuK (DUF458 family)
MWQSFKHKQIADIEQTILTDIANAPTKTLTFFIGSDSQFKKGKIKFITAIVMLFDGHGGRGYYLTQTEKLNYEISIRQKIIQETSMSLEAAVWLNPLLETLGYEISEIHADVNKDPMHKSNVMMKDVMGWIEAMGYTAKAKPESWVAMECADKFSK